MRQRYKRIEHKTYSYKYDSLLTTQMDPGPIMKGPVKTGFISLYSLPLMWCGVFLYPSLDKSMQLNYSIAYSEVVMHVLWLDLRGHFKMVLRLDGLVQPHKNTLLSYSFGILLQVHMLPIIWLYTFFSCHLTEGNMVRYPLITIKFVSEIVVFSLLLLWTMFLLTILNV